MKTFMSFFVMLICICPMPLRAHEKIIHLSDEETEAIQLEKFSNITRNKWVLEVKTPKSVVTFKDKRDAEEGYKRFYLIGFIRVKRERVDYLIHTHEYEGYYYVLVNGVTAQQVLIRGIPVLSPDLKHYVVTSLDLGAGYNPNSIQIFKTSDYQLEWEYQYQSEKGPSDAIWLNENKIVFFENRNGKIPTGRDYFEKEPYIIGMKNGKWQSPRLLQ